MNSTKSRKCGYGLPPGKLEAAQICDNLYLLEKGDKMLQKDLNGENLEIKNKVYNLYEKHGFKDGNDFINWLEEEKQSGKFGTRKKWAKLSRLGQSKRKINIFLFIIGFLCVIIVILSFMFFNGNSRIAIAEKNLSDLKVMMLVLDPKDDEKVVIFGDTNFDYSKSTLNQEAETLLEKDVQVLKDNPQINVRMAGYTSAQGSEKVNQELSEKRANAVRDYLIEKGITPERISVIGYGRTRPAVYEVTPGDVHSKEALANMRVLFEVIVK